MSSLTQEVTQNDNTEKGQRGLCKKKIFRVGSVEGERVDATIGFGYHLH